MGNKKEEASHNYSSGCGWRKALRPDELKNYGAELGRNLKKAESTEVLRSSSDSLSPKAKKEAMTSAMTNLPDETKKEIAGMWGYLSPDTRNKLWKITAYAFAIGVVNAFLFLAANFFF